MTPLKLSRDRTLILAIDLQERLAAAMPPVELAALRRNALILLEGAKVLDVPVIVSEQYPRGLGPTLPDVRAALAPSTPVLEKTAFSCLADDGLCAALAASGRRQIVVLGMEAHVCVYQTARDLVAAGYAVHVVVDAVLSRTTANTQIGLDLARGAGAVSTSVEAVLFDLLERAGGDAFKAVSRLVK